MLFVSEGAYFAALCNASICHLEPTMQAFCQWDICDIVKKHGFYVVNESQITSAYMLEYDVFRQSFK